MTDEKLIEEIIKETSQILDLELKHDQATKKAVEIAIQKTREECEKEKEDILDFQSIIMNNPEVQQKLIDQCESNERNRTLDEVEKKIRTECCCVEDCDVNFIVMSILEKIQELRDEKK